MTAIADLERQAAWELEGVRRAQAKFIEAAKATDPDELPGGQALLRAVVPAVIERLTQDREEGLEMLGKTGGRQPLRLWHTQTLDLEQAAVITVCTAMRTWVEMSSKPEGVTVTALAREIARTIRLQIEFEAWKAEQERQAKDAKKRGDKDHDDLWKRLRNRYPEVSRKVWCAWRRKADAVSAEWDEATEIDVGAWLIDALVKSSGGRFAIETVRSGPLTTLVLRISEETLKAIEDRNERRSVARPLLMPMITPPLPWRYED